MVSEKSGNGQGIFSILISGKLKLLMWTPLLFGSPAVPFCNSYQFPDSKIFTVSWFTTWGPEIKDAFHKSIQYAPEKLGKWNLALKKKQQYQILKAVVMMKREILAVLPTVFGKSLMYQSLGFIFDFLRSDSDSQHTGIIVVLPLNALMQDNKNNVLLGNFHHITVVFREVLKILKLGNVQK